jgi:RNA polymerase sigma-70 factor (ECF subfamily)
MSLEFSEEELVKGCLEKVPAYQRALYKRYASKMLTVCLRYANSREEAEDILQEGFITVFEKLGQFKMEGSFEGWIRRIMVNRSIESYRRTSRVYPVLDIEDVEDMFVSHDNVESTLSAKELLIMVQELPPMYKMVFNLYAFEGMTHKEISESLGIAEGTSKSNLSDARNLLKKKIARSMMIAKKNELNEQHARG